MKTINHKTNLSWVWAMTAIVYNSTGKTFDIQKTINSALNEKNISTAKKNKGEKSA